jgi:transposase
MTYIRIKYRTVSDWKKLVLDELPYVFDKGESKSKQSEVLDIESVTAPLFQQIGQLKVELDYLKKKCGSPK